MSFCSDCKGTGKITLFTSVVPCHSCQKFKNKTDLHVPKEVQDLFVNRPKGIWLHTSSSSTMKFLPLVLFNWTGPISYVGDNPANMKRLPQVKKAVRSTSESYTFPGMTMAFLFLEEPNTTHMRYCWNHAVQHDYVVFCAFHNPSTFVCNHASYITEERNNSVVMVKRRK